jgi:hypothetical protein
LSSIVAISATLASYFSQSLSERNHMSSPTNDEAPPTITVLHKLLSLKNTISEYLAYCGQQFLRLTRRNYVAVPLDFHWLTQVELLTTLRLRSDKTQPTSDDSDHSTAPLYSSSISTQSTATPSTILSPPPSPPPDSAFDPVLALSHSGKQFQGETTQDSDNQNIADML